jgi:hypothetical protein
LEKGYPLRLNKLESPPPKDDLCQFWLNWPGRSEKSKMWKFTDGQTDTGQQAIRKAHSSFQLRWAKKRQRQ